MAAASNEIRVLNYLLGAASVVIIVAGMRAAQPLVVPFLTAAFLAVICTPALIRLQQKGVPTVVALLLVIGGVSLVLLVVGVVVATSITDFVDKSPGYLQGMTDKIDVLKAWLVEKEWIEEGTGPVENYFNAQRVMNWFKTFLTSLAGLFSNTILVLLTLIFMLLEASGLPDKLVAMGGGTKAVAGPARRIGDAIIQYMSLKTTISLVTGGLAGVIVKALGVDYPVLWGLLAFFFNYVPNIGSFIAAVPPVVLAWIQFDLKTAIFMAIGYTALNGIMGNIIEPRVMGKGLGLSTLVVFVSLVFWGWALGPVGMLLSVPLTMIVKITLENFQETRPLAILLSASAEE